jgi:ribulose-5-phosphate 4-epimerase/fuculose-1-phosphate aldolase
MKPEPGHLIPDLSAAAELALLCRILAREGYQDNIAGHITFAQEDGTLLANPFELVWEEVRASDVIRIDRAGKVVEGKWSITPAIPLHLEIHKERPDIHVALHNHPRWSTIWADAGRIPPVYDQTSAYIDAEIALFDEYMGGVTDVENARAAAAAIGGAGCALLVNHGAVVVGVTIQQAHLRAIALETRSRNAWHVEALGAGARQMLPEVADKLHNMVDKPNGRPMPHLWQTAVRRELRIDPSVLN